jgi:hypothetical protein
VKRRSAIVLAIVLAFALLIPFALSGQTRAVGPASVLAVLAGRVELAHGTAAYTSATDGETVVSGDRVRTDAVGRAVITFFDGSTLELAPATEVTVAAAASPDGAVDLLIAQTIGRTVSSVHKLVDPRSRYEIRTPSLTAAVRGTKFEVVVAADGSAIERTSEGLVAVSSAGAAVLVPAGMETRTAPGTAPTAPTPLSARATASAAAVTAPPPSAATPAPAQGSDVSSSASPSPLAGPSAAGPATPGTTAPSSVAAGPAIATISPLTAGTPAPLPIGTLGPLPTLSLAPLPTLPVAPLPTASLAPPPTLPVAPLPTALLAPITPPLTSTALPVAPIP